MSSPSLSSPPCPSPLPLPVIDTLIIVCAHAIYLGPPTPLTSASTSSSTSTCTINPDESNWLLEPFQAGETPTYIRHVEAGVRELVETKGKGILVFSGGRTKREKTERSEAEGYFNLAMSHDLFGLGSTSLRSTSHTNTEQTHSSSISLRNRIFLDNHATDSYQNILFPLLQFPSYLSQLSRSSTLSPTQPLFPTRLIIISHAFKSTRFLHLHIPALHFAIDRVKYVGIDPPFLDAESDEYDSVKAEETLKGEMERGVKPWEEDLYGVGNVLGGKRRKRGWEGEESIMKVILGKGQEGEMERKELWRKEDKVVLERLLRWDGGESGKELFPERLPWE